MDLICLLYVPPIQRTKQVGALREREGCIRVLEVLREKVFLEQKSFQEILEGREGACRSGSIWQLIPTTNENSQYLDCFVCRDGNT